MQYEPSHITEPSSPISEAYSGYYIAYLRDLQQVLYGDFEQVKAGVTYVASPPITSDGRADRLPFFRAFLRWVAKGSSHFKQW